MNNNTATEVSFWLICESPERCHCDWRTTIENCVESKTMYYIYMTNTILSATLTVIGSAILYHRVFNKQLPVFDIRSGYSSGFLIRPRPIESMLFFGIVFNALRIINTTLLLTNAIPNYIVKAFLYELPWQFGLCAFACYLFGIAHTISHSNKVIKNSWFRSSLRIDVLCTILITSPFISNNICSIAAAVFAEQGDNYKAKLFTDALYFLWTAYCFILAVCILFAGYRLLKILRHHLKNQEDRGSATAQKIKHGAFKVKMIMAISVTSLFIFSFIKLMYGLFRVRLLLDYWLNLAIAIIWTFDGTAASLLVVITLLFNPKALTPLSPSSTTESVNRIAESNFNISTESHHYNTATGDNGVTNLSDLENAPKALYQGGYPLSNVSSINEDQKKYHSSFIVESNFEQSGISETHLVPTTPETKTYNMNNK